MKHQRDLYANTPTGYQDEKNDCSIRAFAVAACISYEKSYEYFEQAGRRPGKPTPWETSLYVWRNHFPKAIIVSKAKGLTIKDFTAIFHEGHFLVHVYRHAIAVCDGVVYDWRPSPLKKVRLAIRLDVY